MVASADVSRDARLVDAVGAATARPPVSSLVVCAPDELLDVGALVWRSRADADPTIGARSATTNAFCTAGADAGAAAPEVTGAAGAERGAVDRCGVGVSSTARDAATTASAEPTSARSASALLGRGPVDEDDIQCVRKRG